MKKNKIFKHIPQQGGNDGHHDLLCRILCLVENLEHKVNHLVREGDHIENLIKALSPGASDQEGLKAILDAINANKAKLAAALPAGTTNTPSPQG